MTDKTNAQAVRQVGYLVEDIEAACADHELTGVRKWMRSEVEPGGRYRGGPSSGSIKVAIGYSGDLQIELIEAVGPGASVWHEFRDAKRFGVHHVAHWYDDLDEGMAAVGDRAELVQLVTETSPRYAYFQTDSGLLLELMELTPRVREFMEAARR
ncbi:VOC family protein [Nocardioides alcanivorans]|uniref:VOC family protein n=1 Tax=Nocardioides alcanivorans TaxID=2897352 RepID=UPI001F431B8C|nr:VOC family protein [Nocardioides alcanivorans]